MEIRDYTHIWDMKRTLYTIGDMSLPRPISALSAGVFIMVGILWIPPIVLIFSPPLDSPFTWLLVLGVPFLAANLSSKPIFEGKNIGQFVISQLTYLVQPKGLSDMAPDNEPLHTQYTLESKWWEPTNQKSVRTRKKRKK